MFSRLLLTGLVLIPFYEFFLYLFIPGARIPEWIDMRVTKEYVATGLALALAITAWIENKKLNCSSLWSIVFIGFLFFNLSKSPISVSNPIVDVSRIGNFRGEFEVIVFFLFFCAMTTVRIEELEIKYILKVIFWCGVAMSIYMIIQSLRLDQIYKAIPADMRGDVKSPSVAGFFGQPTLAVPFVFLVVPIAIYFKKWIHAALMTIAGLLTGSDFAIACLICLITFYAVKINKKFLILVGASALPLAVMFIKKPFHYFEFNGRIEVWRQIFQDVFSGQINGVKAHIGMTGAGLDSFGPIFSALHNSPFTFAHNEYMQMLWACGTIGLAIFLMIHFEIFKLAWKLRNDAIAETLAVSLMILCVCANGTFVFQLGVYQFYTVVIVGLIYQIARRKAVSQ